MGNDNKIQDGLRLNELKNDPTNEKFKEETLGGSQSLEENFGNIVRKRKKKQKSYALSLIDTLICVITIGPLVVGFWRGTWYLMDIHEDMFPMWLCFTFGIIIHIMFAFVKHQLYDYVSEKRKENLLNCILCQLLRIAYTYVFGVMCVMHWRGGWILLDKYFNMNVLWINASLTTSLFGSLIILRCMRNLLAPPFIVAIDNYSRLFIFPSLCKRVSKIKSTN